MAGAFNEWMRRYIEEPGNFERQFKEAIAFIGDENHGRTPTYGDRCAAYLARLMDGE